jgi:hypothetical protein
MEALINLGLLCGTMLVILLLAEGLLNLLPIIKNVEYSHVTKVSPILHYKPNCIVKWSRDWNFSLANRRRINNTGFLNDQTYEKDEITPLLGVIGDSYVEAIMVPYSQTFYGRLADQVGKKKRIYSFGISGSPLSQYLALAKFCCKKFRPDGLIFIIIANDFDESFYRYKPTRGFHYFLYDTTVENVSLLRVDRIDSKLRKSILNTATGRYLFYHLHISQVLRQMRIQLKIWQKGGEPVYIGNVPAQVSSKHIADSKRAADLFLAALSDYTGLPQKRIAFLVDGLRPNVYEPKMLQEGEKSFWEQIRNYFIKVAREKGYEVLDLNPAFIKEYQRSGKRFEFECDGHWNSFGHEMAANQIKHSRLFHTLFFDNN